MKIYHYDRATGEYLGEDNATQSPLEPDVWLIPAYATTERPPVPGLHQAAVFNDLNGNTWQIVPDWRGTVRFSIVDGHEVKVEALGQLPEDLPDTTSIFPPDVPAGQRLIWTGDTWALEDIPIPPPSRITMRQARLVLLSAGLLDKVNAAIAAMQGAAGEAARIEWEYAHDIERTNPLFSQLAEALGLSEAQIDNLFIEAAKL
jgi:hypothetical protein